MRDASGPPTARNGSITGVFPSLGQAPFRYAWAGQGPPITGTDSIGGLAPGSYTVTITDGKGCQDVRTFVVALTTAVFDANSPIGSIKIAPNPTSGLTLIDVEYLKPVDAQIQVFNMVGQQLYQMQSSQSAKETYSLDMSQYPSGMYLVRITADSKSYTAKVVKK